MCVIAVIDVVVSARVEHVGHWDEVGVVGVVVGVVVVAAVGGGVVCVGRSH